VKKLDDFLFRPSFLFLSLVVVARNLGGCAAECVREYFFSVSCRFSMWFIDLLNVSFVVVVKSLCWLLFLFVVCCLPYAFFVTLFLGGRGLTAAYVFYGAGGGSVSNSVLAISRKE
jgi:hypothetical protein